MTLYDKVLGWTILGCFALLFACAASWVADGVTVLLRPVAPWLFPDGLADLHRLVVYGPLYLLGVFAAHGLALAGTLWLMFLPLLWIGQRLGWQPRSPQSVCGGVGAEKDQL